MKLVKILPFLLLGMVSASAFAQRGNMDPNQMAQRQTDTIKKYVSGITSDEETKILTIEQDFSKSAQEARNSSDGDRDAMRTKMEALRKDRDDKIKAVLTADQYTQYTKMPKEHRGGGQRKSKD